MAAVVDASALGDFLRGARRDLPAPPLHVPALCDLEVTAQFRRLLLRKHLTEEAVADGLALYLALPLRRHRHQPFLERIIELRDNFSAYDASYVALAERLGLPFLTADARLARAVRNHLPVVALL